MYSPPKKIFEKTSQTPTKVENQSLRTHSLLKKSLKKSSTTAALEEKSVNKTNQKSEAVRTKGRLYSNIPNKKISNEFPETIISEV